MQITMFQHVRPAWLAKTKLRTAEEIAMLRGIFVEGRRQTLLILANDKNKKEQENLLSKLVYYSPKQDDHKQRTLQHSK